MHYQFGDLVDTGIPRADDTGTEGFLDHRQMILLRNNATFAVEANGESAFAHQFVGRVNKSEDTISATFLMCWEDAGAVCADMVKAAGRAGPEAVKEFEAGFDRSTKEN